MRTSVSRKRRERQREAGEAMKKRRGQRKGNRNSELYLVAAGVGRERDRERKQDGHQGRRVGGGGAGPRGGPGGHAGPAGKHAWLPTRPPTSSHACSEASGDRGQHLASESARFPVIWLTCFKATSRLETYKRRGLPFSTSGESGRQGRKTPLSTWTFLPRSAAASLSRDGRVKASLIEFGRVGGWRAFSFHFLCRQAPANVSLCFFFFF